MYSGYYSKKKLVLLKGGRILFSKYNFEPLHASIFTVSLFLTYFGTILPWLYADEYTVYGIQTPIGLPIIILLSISLGVLYFVRNKKKLVSSIILVAAGLLCLIAVLFAFFSYSVIVFGTPFGLLISFGAGIYMTIVGSIGLTASGIIGFIRRKK